MSPERSNSMIGSILATSRCAWKTATSYESSVTFPVDQFYSVANFLLLNPNFLSTHLFRGDILFDSTSQLETPEQKESQQCHSASGHPMRGTPEAPLEALLLPGWRLTRTIVRRLIPRNPQLDSSLCQTYHEYVGGDNHLFVFQPHVNSVEELPFYHPPIRGLGYLYRAGIEHGQSRTLSLHVLPFDGQGLSDLPPRYHRMFATMLDTFSKFAHTSPESQATTTKPPKDNILPQHVVQNTYTRLKETYASKLFERWVEKTDPSKHVFEDLSIAAFLIELWRQMYRVVPLSERTHSGEQFPGFVDIACGNGVLAYILIKEGYRGWGFDARKRKTWSTFPRHVQDELHEMICIPAPFAKRCSTTDLGVSFHDGLFTSGTFIISNHADELTPWTPILATLSDQANPLPFLVIPCCSHALDGTRFRYIPKKAASSETGDYRTIDADQPRTGDLRAMKRAKEQQKSPSASTYASLTDHVAGIANELGYQVEQTLMRIPSTRNIGLIGREMHKSNSRSGSQHVLDIIERECGPKGGTDPAATRWISRCIDLHMGRGHGTHPA